MRLSVNTRVSTGSSQGMPDANTHGLWPLAPWSKKIVCEARKAMSGEASCPSVSLGAENLKPCPIPAQGLRGFAAWGTPLLAAVASSVICHPWPYRPELLQSYVGYCTTYCACAPAPDSVVTATCVSDQPQHRDYTKQGLFV